MSISEEVPVNVKLLGEAKPLVGIAPRVVGTIAALATREARPRLDSDSLSRIDQFMSEPDSRGQRRQAVEVVPHEASGIEVTERGEETESFLFDVTGKYVGHAIVITDKGKREQSAAWINIVNGDAVGDQNERGRGQGMMAIIALARRAIEDGYSFTNDYHGYQLAPIVRIWESLRDAGIAQEVTPFEEGLPGQFKGHYIIPGPKTVQAGETPS